jgi:hypothetical protein
VIDHGPHPDTDVPSARAQAARERLFDSDYALVESLRETGQLWPVAFFAAVIPVGIYLGARGAAGSTPIGGLALAAVALVGGGLALDTHLCKGTPASVYECRRCRRATDRWRGPTRDTQWVTSIVGQGSAAGRTPTPSRYQLDTESEAETPASTTPDEASEPDPLFDTVTAEPSGEDTSAEPDEVIDATDLDDAGGSVFGTATSDDASGYERVEMNGGSE